MDETHDRNKTEITHRVTEAAAEWLANQGAKAVETEVGIEQRWVADLAAFWIPTPTEATKAKLTKRKPRYDYDWIFKPKKPKTEELKAQYKKDHEEWKKSYLALPHFITIVHEVKTTRADFKRDDKFTRPPVAHIQALSYLKGMVEEGELPKGWWALEHGKTGTLLGVRKRHPMHDITQERVLGTIASLADRIHNRQANKFFMDLQKSHRNDMRERDARYRISTCLQAVLSIARGEKATFEEAMRNHFDAKEKIPDYIRKNLADLYGKFKENKEDGKKCVTSS